MVVFEPRRSTAMFIGETTRGLAQPVLFDTHTQIFNNKPPVTLVTGAPGSGKDLDVDTLIPTPHGFVRMGDLRTGDKVLDRFSRPCRVTFAGEIRKRPVFEFVFGDGRTIVAGREHQWSVRVIGRGHKKNTSVGAGKHDILSRTASDNATRIKKLQENVWWWFGDCEWATVSELHTVLMGAGVFLLGGEQELEKLLVRYNILHVATRPIQYPTNKPTKQADNSSTVNNTDNTSTGHNANTGHTGHNANTNTKTQYWSVLMALQAFYEECVEQTHLLLHGEKVLTSTQILAHMKKGCRVHIRTVQPLDGTDHTDNGFLASMSTTTTLKDMAPLVERFTNTNNIPVIADRRRELHVTHATKTTGVTIDNNGAVHVGFSSHTVATRYQFLVRSLGIPCTLKNMVVTGKLLPLIGDLTTTQHNTKKTPVSRDTYVPITAIKPTTARETRCISVDSDDHVYLAGDFIPTHNTFFAMTLTCLSAILGKTTVVLDPKGDFLSLSELKGEIGDVNFWVLSSPRMQGILDPFYLAEDRGEKLNLVLETLSLLLGGLDERKLAILSPIIKDTIEAEVPSLMLLKENLEMAPTAEARAIGTQLDIMSRLPFANLCFSDAFKRRKDVTVNEGVTIATLAGLELNPDKESAKVSNKSKLSSAVFFLITDFIRRFMHNSSDTTPKTIIIDEAWAVLATQEGARVIKEIALLARSKNLAMVLITQNVSHLEHIDVENTIASRFAFRTDKDEGEEIIKNMGLPDDQGFENVLPSLNQGECLMHDWRARHSTVQISQYNERWRIAFETNPLEKRRKQREKKRLAQQAQQQAQQTQQTQNRHPQHKQKNHHR